MYCRNFGDPDCPDCLGAVDERYTMDYTDVDAENGLINWCSKCGPLEKAMEQAIFHAIETRPGFLKDFEEAISKAEKEQKENST